MPPVPTPPTPSPAAAGGTPAPQGQPPIGSSPVTGKSPNLGYEAAGAQKLAILVEGMGQTIALVGATSEAGLAIADCIKRLSKFVPAGAVNQVGQSNALDGMRQKQMQTAPLLAQIGKQAPPAGAGGQPPQPAAAA